MDLSNFLRFIWPQSSPARYCITQQSVSDQGEEFWKNHWCDSIQAAVDCVAKLTTKGLDVFHCMAAFAPGSKNRYDKNVVAVRAFYIDLDVARPGSAKPNTYATVAEALHALAAFVRATGLPTPNMLVSSGWGVHVYWVISHDLPMSYWRPIANGLRNLAVAHGIRFDQQVTTTLSRVLRTPGSWNYKNKTDPKPARVLWCSGSYIPYAALQGLGASNPSAHGPLGSAPAASHGINSDLSAGLDQARGPTSMANVVRKCPVMQQMFLTGGAIGGYPLWRDMLSIAAFTDDGHLLVDAMSYRHHTYSRAELERQWQYAVERKGQGSLGPGRCQTIAGEGGQSAVCRTCPHNGVLTSPIQLSYGPAFRQTASAAAAGTAAPVLPMNAAGVAAPPTSLPALQDPEPPYGFQLLPQGGFGGFVTEKDSDVKVLVPIMAGRISRIERRHEDVKGTQARPGSEPVVLLVVYHPTTTGPGRHIRVPIGALNLKNDAILGGLGFVVLPGRHREALQMLRSWSDQLARAVASQFEVKHYGWTDHQGKRCFAVGDRVHWDDGRSEKTLAPPATSPIYALHGTLPQWRQAAQVHHDVFTQPLRAILAASFAAPLVHLSGRAGGRLLSVAGSDTGVGKSTAMELAQSVWGDTMGTLRMNATASAVPEFVSQLKSLPVFWDETRGVDPEAYMNLMFSIVEGRGRMRLNSSIELREAASWNNMVVTASNFSTRDRAALTETVPGEGPQKARIFECTVPGPQHMHRVQDLHLWTQQAIANRAHAGDAYIRFIVPRWREIARKISELETGLGKMLDAPTSSRFHISTMALLLAGAWLATQAGVLAFDMPALRDYLVAQYRMMISSNVVPEHVNGQGAGPPVTAAQLTDQHAVAIMEQFLSSHQASTLATYSSTATGKGRPANIRVVKQPLLRNGDATQVHIILNQGEMLIDSREFSSWLVKTGRVRQLVLDLFRNVFGATENQRTLGAGTPFSRLRVFALIVPLNHPELAELAQSYANGFAGMSIPSGTDAAGLAPPSQSPYLVH